MAAHLSGSAGLWVSFALVVLALLAFDLGIFRKSARDPSTGEALAWSALWFLLACAFGAGLTATLGPTRGVEFFTAYLVEQSLSVDNLFVMMLVFGGLGIERGSQRRVLIAGILGAAALRAILIFAGTAAVARFHVLGYALGGLLLVSGGKILREALRPSDAVGLGLAPGAAGGTPRLAASAVRLLSRFVPITDRPSGDRFTTVVGGVRHATVLLVALVTIEVADIVFALDSIPAVLGVSSDSLVVVTSNVFAILGLRSLYFALSGLLARLRYLKHGLAAVLVLVGTKMLLGAVWPVPTWLSLVAVLGTLAVAALASLVTEKAPRAPNTEERDVTHAS